MKLLITKRDRQIGAAFFLIGLVLIGLVIAVELGLISEIEMVNAKGQEQSVNPLFLLFGITFVFLGTFFLMAGERGAGISIAEGTPTCSLESGKLYKVLSITEEIGIKESTEFIEKKKYLVLDSSGKTESVLLYERDSRELPKGLVTNSTVTLTDENELAIVSSEN